MKNERKKINCKLTFTKCEPRTRQTVRDEVCQAIHKDAPGAETEGVLKESELEALSYLYTSMFFLGYSFFGYFLFCPISVSLCPPPSLSLSHTHSKNCYGEQT